MIMRSAGGRAGGHSWAVVLAGGSGTRLRGRTVDHTGQHVPKQYCLVDDRHTLLQLALARARNLVDPTHVVVVVLDEHRKWWEPQLEGVLPPENVVSQPFSRGTAVGVLLPLLHVLARDPEAHVIVFPTDHYFRDEERLARAILQALEHTFREPGSLVFVGIEPESPASEFGYLLPEAAGDVDPRPLAAFVEKPARELAKRLIARGALWNTLIFAARGRRVLTLIRERLPKIADTIRGAMVLADDPLFPARALVATYPGLSTADLSSDVLECSACPMAVTAATGVGWLELGTPDHVVAFWDRAHRGEPNRPLEMHPPWEPAEELLPHEVEPREVEADQAPA